MLSLFQVGKPQYHHIFIQIRTATKKAAGSRTSMKDSAGRRLGPKKYDGQSVKPGEIIMRQRGTKIYPGEYVGIGKDHTLFALEPGFVRYYLDPFHPRKKFVGISLKEDVKLPIPHFEPTPRRFGHILLDNKKAAIKEESSLSRKEYLVRNSILEKHKQRMEGRNKLLEKFRCFLKDTMKVENVDENIGSHYLLRLRMLLRNGFFIEEARFYSKQYMLAEANLQSKREQWTVEQLQLYTEKVNSACKYLNENVCFDNKLNVVKAISVEEKRNLKNDLLTKLKEEPSVTAKKIKNGAINVSSYFTLSEETKLNQKVSSLLQTKSKVEKQLKA